MSNKTIEKDTSETNRGPGKRVYKTYEDLVEPRLSDIYNWRSKGKTITYIASKLGISKTTFYEWQKLHPEITDVLKEADITMRESLISEAQKSLMTKLKDRTVKEKTVEKIVDENGEFKEKTILKERKVLADTTAIIFTLRNTDPNTWNSADNRLAEARIKKIDNEISVGSEELDMNKEILDIFKHYGNRTVDIPDDSEDVNSVKNEAETEALNDVENDA